MKNKIYKHLLFPNKYIYLLAYLFTIKITDCYIIDASFTPKDAHVVKLNCTKPYSNVYFDVSTKTWLSQQPYSMCLNTDKDVLAFCQRAYPQLNVVNIHKMERTIKFVVYQCDPQRLNKLNLTRKNVRTDLFKTACPKYDVEYAKSYRCLYGKFKPTQLEVPQSCQFQHLESDNECKTDEHWRQLSHEKCKSSDSVLNSSFLLEWCDAFAGGISTFRGIEFVCCPKSRIVIPPTQSSSSSTSSYDTIPEDDDIDDDETDDYPDESSNEKPPILNSLVVEERTEKVKLKLARENIDNSDNRLPMNDYNIQESGVNFAKIFFIIGFTLTIVFSIVFLLTKKRLSNRKTKEEFAPIRTGNPEDNHINSMQVNGYVNPTYKFFEHNPTA